MGNDDPVATPLASTLRRCRQLCAIAVRSARANGPRVPFWRRWPGPTVPNSAPSRADAAVAAADRLSPWPPAAGRPRLARASRPAESRPHPSSTPTLVHADEQLRARRHWVTLDHPVMGASIYDASPYRLSATPGRLRTPAPLLGADTRAVCTDLLGVAERTYDELEEQGVVG